MSWPVSKLTWPTQTFLCHLSRGNRLLQLMGVLIPPKKTINFNKHNTSHLPNVKLTQYCFAIPPVASSGLVMVSTDNFCFLASDVSADSASPPAPSVSVTS